MGRLGCEAARVWMLPVKEMLLSVALPSPTALSFTDLYRTEVLVETAESK